MLIPSCPKYLYQTILLEISTFRGYQIEDRNTFSIYITYRRNTVSSDTLQTSSDFLEKGFNVYKIWEIYLGVRNTCS
jgi:hypothetical protein